MPSVKHFQYTFNAGELSRSFDGRLDHPRYFAGAREVLNYFTLPLGGIERRHGLRFVGPVKDHTTKVCLLRFEFSVTQAFLLEVGHQYIRFYKNGGRIESPPGVPAEVATPYLEPHLFELQTVQSADVMWIAHPSYPPAKLLRLSDTSWSYQVIAHDPPPSAQAPLVMPHTLTLGATAGSAVTFTAGAAVFLHGDVGRHISLVSSQGSQGRAVITALNSTPAATAVTVAILSPFPSLMFGPNTWHIDGTLGVGLRIQPVTTGQQAMQGTLCKALLVQRGIFAAELITNGTFSGLTGWDDHSGSSIASGTHNGGANSSDLQDTTAHFPALGITVGFRAVNNTDGSGAIITAIRPGGNALGMTLAGGSENDWDVGDDYDIFGSGGAVATNGGAQLSAGPGGIGWIEQDITTIAGQTYRVTFDVQEGPISVMVGAGSKSSDVFGETTYPVGKEREVIFTAISSASFISFRNNQPTMSRVSNVSAKNISAAGWRAGDVGSFIKAHNGVFEILGLDNSHSANVLVRTAPDPISGAFVEVPAGAWSLEVPAWSASRGYPRAVSFHQQRLAYAGTTTQPLTVWQSEIRNYDGFGASSLADSSLEQEFSANTMNTIQWMHPFRDLLVGTAASEHLLRGVNGPLTPSNGEQLPQTHVGSSSLPPLRIDNALILLQRGGQQIKEVLIDENGQVIRGMDHTLLAEHITESGIVQWAMQSKPVARIWAARVDGILVSETYEQVEQVRGWHRHITDGIIESVCVVPINSPTDQHTEEVYVVVKRNVGGIKRYVERFDPNLLVDSGLSYSGGAVNNLTGLDHMEGRTVKVVDQSSGKPAVLLDRIVSSGSITLETTVTAADVGLAYSSRLITMRPEIPLRDGTMQGRKKRWQIISARCLDTLGLFINGKPSIFRTPADDLMGEGMAPRTGDATVTNLGWDRDGRMTILQTEPLPGTILSLYGDLEIEEG